MNPKPKFYAGATGVKISSDAAAEQILERFFSSDRAFQAYLTAQTAK